MVSNIRNKVKIMNRLENHTCPKLNSIFGAKTCDNSIMSHVAYIINFYKPVF